MDTVNRLEEETERNDVIVLVNVRKGSRDDKPWRKLIKKTIPKEKKNKIWTPVGS